MRLMCGRFNLRRPMTVLAEQFLFDLGPLAGEAFRPRYNIAPTQGIPVVRLADGKRQLAVLHWDMIPPWVKDKKIAYSTINARGDTVASKPAFRSAYKRRRCLVLADGLLRVGEGRQGQAPLALRAEGPAALGLRRGVLAASRSRPAKSCTIITTDANELASQFHDRMPMNL